MTHNLAQCRLLVQKAVTAGAKVDSLSLSGLESYVVLTIASRPYSCPKHQTTSLQVPRKRFLSVNLPQAPLLSSASNPSLVFTHSLSTSASTNPLPPQQKSQTPSSGSPLRVKLCIATRNFIFLMLISRTDQFLRNRIPWKQERHYWILLTLRSVK